MGKEKEYLKKELDYLFNRGLIAEDERNRMRKALGFVEDEEVSKMRVSKVEVSYGKKFPTGRFRSEWFGIAMTVDIDSNDETQVIEQIHSAYSNAKDIVRNQIEFSNGQGNSNNSD